MNPERKALANDHAKNKSDRDANTAPAVTTSQAHEKRSYWKEPPH
jgi:hypothetical protein